MLDTVLARHFEGAIGAAVVDDQSLDPVDSRKSARQLVQCKAERRFLVKTWNLNDQLHHVGAIRLLTVPIKSRASPSRQWRSFLVDLASAAL